MGKRDIDEAAVRIQHFATRLIRLARSSHKEHKLSSAQFSALAVLNESPGISVVELARRELVSHPTMSRLVAGLIRLEFVTRSPDPADARSRLLKLTPTGSRIYREVAERRVMLFQALLSQLSPATVDEILRVIELAAPKLESLMAER